MDEGTHHPVGCHCYCQLATQPIWPMPLQPATSCHRDIRLLLLLLPLLAASPAGPPAIFSKHASRSCFDESSFSCMANTCCSSRSASGKVKELNTGTVQCQLLLLLLLPGPMPESCPAAADGSCDMTSLTAATMSCTENRHMQKWHTPLNTAQNFKGLHYHTLCMSVDTSSTSNAQSSSLAMHCLD